MFKLHPHAKNNYSLRIVGLERKTRFNLPATVTTGGCSSIVLRSSVRHFQTNARRISGPSPLPPPTSIHVRPVKKIEKDQKAWAFFALLLPAHREPRISSFQTVLRPQGHARMMMKRYSPPNPSHPHSPPPPNIIFPCSDGTVSLWVSPEPPAVPSPSPGAVRTPCRRT